jgi:hypothetical protein
LENPIVTLDRAGEFDEIIDVFTSLARAELFGNRAAGITIPPAYAPATSSSASGPGR